MNRQVRSVYGKSATPDLQIHVVIEREAVGCDGPRSGGT
jgi:hypothetical protein